MGEWWASLEASTAVAAIVEFDKTLDVGNLLTSITILISLAALLNALAKDRRSREREFADAIRAAAARTLGKLDRWQQLSARLYQNVQPLFVDVSQKLHAELDAEAALDLLWRGLAEARTVAEQRIVDEEIENAYVELYPYHPSVEQRFLDTMSRLKEIDSAVYVDFVRESQAQVLAYGGARKDYTSAMLGNDLRVTSAHAEHRLLGELSEALQPIRRFLVAVVGLPDKKIADRSAISTEPVAAVDG